MKNLISYRNKARLLCLAVLQVFRTAGTIGVALLLNQLIDAVANAILTEETNALLLHAGFCCAYALLLGALILLCEKCKAHTVKHIMLNIRKGVIHGILEKDIPDFQSENNAEYLTLLTQNLATLEENYLKNMVSIYESCLSILFALGMLISIHPVIAAISVAAMAIPSFIPKLFGNTLGKLQSAIMQHSSSYNARIKDILNGFELVKTYQISDHVVDLHTASALAVERCKTHYAEKMGWVIGLASMSSVAVQFLIMTLSGVFAVHGWISIGSIVAVTQLTGQVISPAFQLSAKISQFKAVQPVCKQITDLTQESVQISRRAVPVHTFQELALHDVSFSYGKDPVLQHINVSFQAGKKYAIIGKSGCGKSTLLKLIAGYFAQYEGSMTVDGSRNAVCDSTMISQNVLLFDDTIRNNLTLYSYFSEEEIHAAIHAVGLDNVVAALDEGLETSVEENGKRFSGGEKQRIAMARALLHRKKLMLFDEATASLDNESAKNVEDCILGLDGVTCITVTHRLLRSVLEQYDQILVMEHGKLVASGTYRELVEQSISVPFGSMLLSTQNSA